MPAKAKLTDAEVKKIPRRVQAGAWRSELARAYGSGKTVGSTCESNAERMAAALERRLGPLSVVPA